MMTTAKITSRITMPMPTPTPPGHSTDRGPAEDRSAVWARYRQGHTAAGSIWELCAALTLARDYGNDQARASIHLNLSAAYRSKCAVTYGNTSLKWAQQALHLFRTLGDLEGEARASMSIGQAYALTGDLPAARLHASRAREIFGELGATTHSRLASELLAGIPRMPLAPAECLECQHQAESFRSWLEDLPHAVLRGNDDRLHEFIEMTGVCWWQATPHAKQ